MIVWQANASSNELRNESEKDSKIEHMNKWPRTWSWSHTGIHLGSENRSEFESGEKKHFGSGFKLGSGNKMRSEEKIWSGKKEHMNNGDKEHYGSGNKLGTGVNKNMDKKTKKLDSVFKKMTDEKITSLLTQINTLSTTITDPTLLSIINNIKTLMQQNIGN